SKEFLNFHIQQGNLDQRGCGALEACTTRE
ncbi:MAG: hypothetical protein H6Q87_1495, partial [candidate division NC10 bacterium]|nr:hypothetical protein [candidate division NC10 bacterium]